jgi:antitoxin (DNA-binding transcriptional repressor) of toxin-antitoxin stability system
LSCLEQEDRVSESLTVTEVVRHFAEYLNRVAYRRESFVLVRGNKAIAELRPLPSGKRLGELPGLFASLPHLSADEAGAFAEDLESARGELAGTEVRDPWAS